MSERHASVALRAEKGDMIDEFSKDASGWARFSNDKTKRYRLARSLRDGWRISILPHQSRSWLIKGSSTQLMIATSVKRVVFVMLNPSTADAFKLDPTVSRCREFARRWGADMLEVVNLYALRSSNPRDLDKYIDKHGTKALCEDVDNDAAILGACDDADIIVAAWGNNAWRGARGTIVRSMLRRRNLQHLGLTKNGAPLHPLARGKSFIPYTRELTVWS